MISEQQLGSSWLNFAIWYTENCMYTNSNCPLSIVYRKSKWKSLDNTKKNFLIPCNWQGTWFDLHCIFIWKSYFKLEQMLSLRVRQISIPLNEMRHFFNGTQCDDGANVDFRWMTFWPDKFVFVLYACIDVYCVCICIYI